MFAAVQPRKQMWGSACRFGAACGIPGCWEDAPSCIHKLLLAETAVRYACS